MTIQPGADADGYFLPYTVDGLPTVWWWQVDDDDAVYSGTAPTQAEAWRQAHAAVDRASPVMAARAEGVAAGLDAMRARAEAAEARAAQARAEGEAAGREAERAAVVAYLRLAAEAHCSPALHEEAGHVEAGHHNAAPE